VVDNKDNHTDDQQADDQQKQGFWARFFGRKKKDDQKTPEATAVNGQPLPDTVEPRVAAEEGYDTENMMGVPHNVLFYRGWYRDQYKRAMVVVAMLSLALIVSVTTNVVVYFAKPRPVYFAATTDLRLAKMTPLGKPLISQGALLNWTAETVTETLSIDFLHWRKQLMRVRPRYSPDAFKQLIASLKSSGNLGMILSQRLSVTSTIAQAPVIIGRGSVEGRLVWKIEFPVLVSYESSAAVKNKQELVATVLVERVSSLEKVQGIHVKQLLLTQKR